MQTVTTEQLGGDYTGITCELDGEGKVEVRKWPLSSIAEQDETQRGSPRASSSSFHVSHYENDVWRFWRLHANLSCFVFVVVLCPFLVIVFRKSLITFTRRLQMKSGLLSPGVNSPPPQVVRRLVVSFVVNHVTFFQRQHRFHLVTWCCTHAGPEAAGRPLQKSWSDGWEKTKKQIPPTGSLWRISRGPSPTISVTFQNCHSDTHTVMFQLCGGEKSVGYWTAF